MNINPQAERMNDQAATLRDIIAAELADHASYEATTVAARINGEAFTIADLRVVFDAVADAQNWKAPIACYVPHNAVAVVIAAVQWFQGDTLRAVGIQALTGKVLLEGNGYQG
jgi:hypothetical protein